MTTTDKDIIDTGVFAKAPEEDFIENLTDWKNPPKVGDLKTDLTSVTSAHDSHVLKVDTWLDNLYVKGKAKPQSRPGYSSVQPMLIRKQAEWRYAALSEPFLSTDKLFTASPVTFEDKLAAEQNELVLNAQFNKHIDLVSFVDTYVRAAVDEGTAILRTGWRFKEETVEVDVPTFEYVPDPSPEAAQLMEQLAAEYQQDAKGVTENTPPELIEALRQTIEAQQIIMPVETGTKKEKQTRTVYNHPTVEVCNYNDVMIDPTCKGDMDKANFVIYRFVTSLSQLRKDGIYKNLDYINPSDATILSMADTSKDSEVGDFKFSDSARKQFHAYEYWGFWDINDTGEVEPIVATFVGDTLIRLDLNPYPDKELPFIAVQYLPIKESIYGEPDGVLIEDNQKIVGAVTRGMIDIMGRSANGQQGSRKDALDAVNKRKFDRGDDYEFNPQVDPRQAFFMHTYPEIPASAQYMLNLQHMEAESLTGVKAFSGGLSGDALGDVATGIRGVLDAASKRELGILRRLASGIVKIGRKFMSMNSEFLAEEEIVRITNEKFVPVRRDDLAGKVDIRLDITTAEEDNQKAQELAFMLQTTAQSMGPEFTKIILADIAKLRKMPALAKEILNYQPQPDPLQQQIQQLQLIKLQEEIKEIQSRTAENYAQAGKAQATAGHLSSQTDLANLDFVEQESGTKHARDVDKITSQAKAQAAKSLLEMRMGKGK